MMKISNLFGAYRAKACFYVLAMFLAGAGSQATAQPSFGNQSSNKHVEWGFDFVETFEGLQEWVSYDGRVGNVHDIAKMPKLLDGSDSAWGYYSCWQTLLPEGKWIGSYGDNRVWRGDKSLTIDIGGPQGPSRFGLSMGKGYQEFYLFYMVNIPKNEFPTSCDGGSCQSGAVGTYTEGENYKWFSSWKMNTFNIGCGGAKCPDRNTYSDHFNFTNHLKVYGYGDHPGITVRAEPGGSDDNRWANDGNTNLNGYLGDWFGIEYHITQTDTQTLMDIWVYDQAGNAVQILNNEVWPTPIEVQGKNWDQLFFGGNNSGTFSWGPTMQSEYNIDDIIIDDQRIGPKYFSLIQGGDPPPSPPLPPSNLSLIPVDQ